MTKAQMGLKKPESDASSSKVEKPPIAEPLKPVEEHAVDTNKALQVENPRASGKAPAPPKIEERSFIPLDLAQAKLKKVVDDMHKMKEKHINALNALQSEHKILENQTKEHYIDFIKDLKSKAAERLNYHKIVLKDTHQKFKEYKETSENVVIGLQRDVQEQKVQKRRLIAKFAKEQKEMIAQHKQEIESMEKSHQKEIERIKDVHSEKLKKEKEVFKWKSEHSMMGSEDDLACAIRTGNTKLEVAEQGHLKEMAIVNADRNILQSELDGKKSQVEELEEQLENHKSEIEQLKADLQERKTEFEEMVIMRDSEAADAKAETSQIKEQLKQMQLSCTTLVKKSKLQVERLNMTSEHCDDEYRVKHRIKSELDSLKLSSSSDTATLNETLTSQKEEITSLNANLDSLKSELDSSVKSLADAKLKIETLETELSEASSNHEKEMTESKEKFNAEKDQLVAEAVQNSSAPDSDSDSELKEEDIKDEQNEDNVRDENNNNNNKELQALRDQLKNLKEELDNEQTKSNQLKEKLDELKNNSSVIEHKEEVKNEVENDTEKEESKQNTEKETVQKSEVPEMEVPELESFDGEEQPDAESPKMELKDMRKKMSALKEHINNLESDLEIANSRISSLGESNDKLSKELSDSNSAKDNIMDELKEKEKELVQVNGEASGLNAQLSAASDQLGSLQKQIRAQKAKIKFLQNNDENNFNFDDGGDMSMPPLPSSQKPQNSEVNEQLEAAKKELEECLDSIETLKKDLTELSQKKPMVEEAKKKNKALIRDWLQAFEEENGHPPSTTDKLAIKDKFMHHKMFDKQIKTMNAQIKQKTAELEALLGTKNNVQSSIEELKENEANNEIEESESKKSESIQKQDNNSNDDDDDDDNEKNLCGPICEMNKAAVKNLSVQLEEQKHLVSKLKKQLNEVEEQLSSAQQANVVAARSMMTPTPPPGSPEQRGRRPSTRMLRSTSSLANSACGDCAANKAEVTTLRGESDELKLEVSKLTSEVRDSEERVKKFESDLKESTEKMKSSIEKTKELETHNEALQRELDELNRSSANNEGSIKQEIESLKEKLTRSENSLQEAREDATKQTKEATALSSLLDTQKLANTGLTSELERIKAKLELLEKSRDGESAESDWLNCIDELEKELTLAHEKSTELEKEFNEKHENENDQWRTEKQHLGDKIQDLESQISDKERQHALVEESLKRAEEALSDARVRSDEASKNADEASQELIESLKKEHANSISLLEKSLEDRQVEIEALQKAKTEAEKTNKMAKKGLKGLLKQKDALEKKIQTLTNELEEAKSNSTNTNSNTNNNDNNNTNSNDTDSELINNLKEELVNTKSTLEKYKNEVESAEPKVVTKSVVDTEAVKKLENDLQQAEDEVQRLTDSENELRATINALETDLQETKDQYELANSEIESLQGEIQEMKEAAEAEKAKADEWINELEKVCRSALVAGQKLWKSDPKKQDCVKLYYKCIQTCSKKIPTGDAKWGTLQKTCETAMKENKTVVVDRTPARAQLVRAKGNLERCLKATVEQLQNPDAEVSSSSSSSSPAKGSRSPTKASSSTTNNASSAADRRELQQLTLKLKQSEDQITRLKKQLDVAEKKIKSSSGGRGPAKSTGGDNGKAAELQSKLNETEKILREMEKKTKTGEMAAKRMEKQITDLQTKLKTADQKAKDTLAKMKKVEQEHKKLQQQQQQSGKADEQLKKQMERKLADAEKKHTKALEELQALMDRNVDNLQTKLSTAEKELTAAQDQIVNLTKERDLLKKKVSVLDNMEEEMTKLQAAADKGKETQIELNTANKRIVELDKLYREQMLLRKKLHNQIEDMKGKIRVFARCRPMSGSEKEKDCKTAVHCLDDCTMRVDSATRGAKEFLFDSVFSPTSGQQQVFDDAETLILSAIDGFNVCIFAYGQTGSGKTFTMTGEPGVEGITPRAINHLYGMFGEMGHSNTFKVKAYMVELYNDVLVDLFAIMQRKGKKKKGRAPAEKKLDIKVDQKGMVIVRNVTEIDVKNGDHLFELFNEGNKSRHVGSTKMNAESSRSHSIFSVVIENYNKQTKKTTVGKLSLVDLAGSERVGKTGATAERLEEAKSINKSLSALGDVISALSSGADYIPYNNNKLTKLMRDSLGGNAKTLMFVNVSPADYNCDETLTSLVYASRVKLITNQAKKTEDSAEITKLKSRIKDLRQQLAEAGKDAEEDEDI